MAKKTEKWFQVESVITLISRVQDYFLVDLHKLIDDYIEKRDKAKKYDLMIEKIKEARNLYPFKITGAHETYCSYNEGWQDALDLLEAEDKKCA